MININDYYYSNFVNNKSELVAHEIGHAFGLDNVSNTSVLMIYSGYKGSHYPEQDDVNGINANY